MADEQHVVVVAQALEDQLGIADVACCGVIARQVDRERLQAVLLQVRQETVEAPGAVEGAVDESDGGHGRDSDG